METKFDFLIIFVSFFDKIVAQFTVLPRLSIVPRLSSGPFITPHHAQKIFGISPIGYP